MSHWHEIIFKKSEKRLALKCIFIILGVRNLNTKKGTAQNEKKAQT